MNYQEHRILYSVNEQRKGDQSFFEGFHKGSLGLKEEDSWGQAKCQSYPYLFLPGFLESGQRWKKAGLYASG